MILVIDAYNVLKQALSVKEVSDHQRERFLKQLRQYGKLKGHKVIVVFDGGPYDMVTKERAKGLLIIYSGVRDTADDVIERYLTEHREQDLLLVSTDRELGAAAKRLGIVTIDSLPFYKKVQEAFRHQRSKPASDRTIKTTDQADHELDTLMHEGSTRVHTKAEDYEPVVPRKSDPHKRSKKERKQQKKFEKL